MSETETARGHLPLGRSLFERGLTPGSSGNISVRCEDGGWLVTPTNASLGSLDPARLSRLGADDRLSPATRRPRNPLMRRSIRPAARRARSCICIRRIR